MYTLIGLAIVARIILIFSFPNLSNDIYRFFWDGLLMHEGIHPLTYLPSEIIDQGIVTDELMNALYTSMNSPHYFTIYPPISQVIFYLSTISSAFSVSTATIIMKLLLFAAELGSIGFIYKILALLQLDKRNVLIYALNPLVIIEIMGNVHYEGVMLFFLLGGIYYLLATRNLVSGLFFAGSIATKLLPLMFLPLVFVYLYKKGRGVMTFSVTLTLSMAVLFVPFFMGLDLSHFMESIDLYFRKFEFNASLYYVLRYVGKVVTGYNQISIIGPLLSVTALGLILMIAWKYYRSRIADIALLSSMFISFVIYLFCTTTVHPWYLIIPIALSVFYNRIWILVWSFLIMLSYSTYQSNDFSQKLWLISLEYIIVIVVWYVERKTRIKMN